MTRLRVPTRLRWVLVGSVVAAGLVGGAIACGERGSDDDDEEPVDAPEDIPIVCCLPDGTDAGVCPEPPICSDILMPPECPPGCRSVG